MSVPTIRPTDAPGVAPTNSTEDRAAFAVFLDRQRCMAPYAKSVFLFLDSEASRIGEQIRRDHPAPAELRARAATYRAAGYEWMSGTNADLADALERDARFAAIPLLAASCYRRYDISEAFVSWYRNYLAAFLKERVAETPANEPSRMTLRIPEGA